MNSSTRQPSEHVLDLAFDYIEGRLDADQTDQVRIHLRDCADCRLDLEHAASMRGAAIESGRRHLHSQRVVELADGVHPTVAEREHLDSCDTCQGELTWAQDLGVPAELLDAAPAERAPRRSWFGLRSRVVQWGGLLATAATVVVLAVPRGSSLMVLADAGPLPVSVDITRSELQAMDRGWIAYAAADYKTSRAEFQQAAAENTLYAAAYLYLGSSQLLLGDASDAVANLLTAAELADPEELDQTGAAAHWLLGNAYLLLDEGASARAQFEMVIALDGLFVDEARTQLDKLDSVD